MVRLGLGRDNAVHSDSLRPGRFGDRIPVGAGFFHTYLDRPWGPPSLL